jgi:uncharacterized protein (PEP-CTERM system associated)
MEVTAITLMGAEHVTHRKLIYTNSCRRLLADNWLTLVLLLFYATSADAGEWTIIPRLTVGEIYSDNIYLDDEDKEADLITEVSPGINISGRSARLEAELDYQMQNLLFLTNTDASNTFQQLNADATAEITQNFFWVDARSRIGQALVSADRTISNNNYNDAGNQTSFYAYGVSPYIRPHFGGYADGTFRYSLDHVRYDDSVSNSLENRFDASLVSGRKFGPLSWVTNYVFDDINRNKASDARYQNADGEARYFISSKFSLVGQAGWSDNDYQTNDAIENGTYWALGGFWQPSRYYSLEALTGENLDTVTASVYPGRRTSLIVTYRDRKVGLNPGEVWFGTFRHRTRRTNWSADYLEDTTTQQQIQLGEDGFTFTVDDEGNDVQVSSGAITSLTNEVIERKRGSGSVSMVTGKTRLRLTIFSEKRRYLTSLREEETNGFLASIDRRVAPRTNAIVTGSWQRIEEDNFDGSVIIFDDSVDNGERDFWFIKTELRRQIRPRLDGMVGYTFTRQDSSRGGERNYSENMVQARITAYF